MTIEKARQFRDGGLGGWVQRTFDDDDDIVIDGRYTADQLEAIAVLMRAGEL